MTYNPKYNETSYQYRKDNIKRIPLDVTLDKYSEIKSVSDSVGESVNGFIKKAIDERIKIVNSSK